MEPSPSPSAGAPPASSPGTRETPSRRLSKRLRRKQRERESAAMQNLPEDLQDSDDEPASSEANPSAPPMVMNMNQSIFGLIAAAGSRVNFEERLDASSEEEDNDDDDNRDAEAAAEADDEISSGTDQQQQDLSQTVILDPKPSKRKTTGRRREKISGARLLKSFHSLPSRRPRSAMEPSKLSAQTSRPEDAGPSSEPITPPDALVADEEERPMPVMSQVLAARAEVGDRGSLDIDRVSSDVGQGAVGGKDEDSTPLAKRLMQIFEFDEPEQVIEEYPCWLLQSVLLQGFLYITTKHICFYAYLPKKANAVAKSGYLSKSGKHNPKYARHWFRLKGDVLSYYKDSTHLYFPHGQIDLRFGISASITDQDKDGVRISLVTTYRTYHFRADSAPSAKEWVKALQRVIFRSHNDGDSVKISLPIENIIDVEETQMIEFADTCKIRVIDNDETYAIDEYFFSFFTFGREAIDVLKILVEDATSGKHDVEKLINSQTGHAPKSSRKLPSQSGDDVFKLDALKTTHVASEPVKATLSPQSTSTSNYPSPRSSTEESTRPSMDAFHPRAKKSLEQSTILSPQQRPRSFSGSPKLSGRQHQDDSADTLQESSDSFLQSSMDDPSYSNLAASSNDDNSASQILKDSVVFHSPTMRRSPSGSLKGDSKGKGKADVSREQSGSSKRFMPHHAVTTGQLNLRPDHQLDQAEIPPASTPTLQSITKMGSYPIQRAGAMVGFFSETGRMLATESMGYVEKVSGMWKGGRRHYDGPAGLRPDEDELERDSEGMIQTSMERFRAHFALPETEKLQATYFGHILRVLPLYGKIYISDRSFCFRSLLPGTRTKLILPLKDIETVHKEKGFRFGYQGLVVVIRGHEEIFFEFGQADVRDDCAITMLQALETTRYLKQTAESQDEADDEDEEADDEKSTAAVAERDALKEARRAEWPEREVQLPRYNSCLSDSAPLLLDETDASTMSFKPPGSLRITCLTIGSRGDVQPYIALCKALKEQGHMPRIATHAEFQGWIESHGIEFKRVEGDPSELMRLCIENGTFTWAFLKEANSTFRGWLDELLDSAYIACQDSDVLIEAPSAMAGIHIAEKLGIPYFRAFTMPWTRTRAYPHAFIMPEHKMGGAYNYMTYVMFDNIFWKAMAHQVNKWRNVTLGLPNTNLEKMQPNKVPFMYSFSPSVVAPPLDFSDWIRVTGYWFLDEGDRYDPPKELDDFMKKARKDGKKIVYVGFGSIIVNDPGKMTQEVIDAVLKADVRCILSKGWSDRISTKQDGAKPRSDEPVMPPEIHVIKSAPHDWLFRRIDAAAHHGGSGTTGASLRAGIPTIIRPFFGDQFFFASRVEDLGVGVWVKKWGTNSFGRALWEATRNERMLTKARLLGEQIRKEKGVETAIQCLYRDMDYARSLVERKAGKNMRAGAGTEDEEEEVEENWTFIGGDEPDPDMVTKKLSEGLPGEAGEKATVSQVLKGEA